MKEFLNNENHTIRADGGKLSRQKMIDFIEEYNSYCNWPEYENDCLNIRPDKDIINDFSRLSIIVDIMESPLALYDHESFFTSLPHLEPYLTVDEASLSIDEMLDYICDATHFCYWDWDFYKENNVSDEEIQSDFLRMKICNFIAARNY